MRLRYTAVYKLLAGIIILIFSLILYQVYFLFLEDFSYFVTLLYLLFGSLANIWIFSILVNRVRMPSKMLLAGILLLAFILRLLWILNIDTTPFSDFTLILRVAKQFAAGQTDIFRHETYFYYYAYNIPFTLYESLVYGLFHSVFVLKFINVLLSTGIVYFLYKILDLNYGEKAARIIALIGAFFPPFILYTSVLTNQTISIFFFLWALTLYFRGKSLFTVGLLIGISQLFRPTAVIYLAGLVILLLLQIFKNDTNELKKTIKNTIFSVLKLVSAYYIVLIISSQLIIWTGLHEKGLFYNPIPSYKFLVGFNHQTTGSYSRDDAALLKDRTHFEERAKKRISERIADKTKLKELLKRKMQYFWGKPDSGLFWSLTKNVKEKRKYKTMRDGIRMFYFAILIYAFIGLILSFKDAQNNDLIIFIGIVFSAYWLVYLFIEIQTRYRYEIYPLLLLLASIGLYKMINSNLGKSS